MYFFLEQPPPRPPQPAALLKSKFFLFFFCGVCESTTPSLNTLRSYFLTLVFARVPRAVLRLSDGRLRRR